MKFEILFPSSEGSRETIVREEAPNWFNALECALKAGGMEQVLNNILCDIKDDGSVHVTDTVSGRKFLIRPFDPNRVAKEEKAIGRTLKKRDPSEVLAFVPGQEPSCPRHALLLFRKRHGPRAQPKVRCRRAKSAACGGFGPTEAQQAVPLRTFG